MAIRMLLANILCLQAALHQNIMHVHILSQNYLAFYKVYLLNGKS